MTEHVTEDAPIVVVAGDADHWRVFRDADHPPERLLFSFRAFLKALAPIRDGVVRFGNTALTDHMADLARRYGLPTIFATSANTRSQSPLVAALATGQRRDRVRALIRVSNLQRDERGNVRQGSFFYLDRTASGLAWVSWEPGARICLRDFRVELLDTARAGFHLRIGAVVENSSLDGQGYRIDPPRFLGMGKPHRNGVYVVIPSDPVEPLRMLDGHGRIGDAEDDALLAFALRAFYGVEEDISRLLDKLPTAPAATLARRAA